LSTEAMSRAYIQRFIDSQLRSRGITDERVLDAMSRVPRHAFVPLESVPEAYGDHPLPIGYGQTISQPYIVAVMSSLLQVDDRSKVLEVGTGSGYQAAVLAHLVDHLYTIEIVPALYYQAKDRLGRLGYGNISVVQGDGYLGLPEHAPYDGIVVTCAPDHVPGALTDQLVDGGHMVIPIGTSDGLQVLWVIENENGRIRSRRVTEVAFVPMTGEH